MMIVQCGTTSTSPSDYLTAAGTEMFYRFSGRGGGINTQQTSHGSGYVGSSLSWSRHKA
jgi:hypothetical protein